jgi:hypothetical protein
MPTFMALPKVEQSRRFPSLVNDRLTCILWDEYL